MNYWQGKQIVVTGGAGMVGSALVRLLLDAGARVTVLDDFSRGKTLVESPFARYVECDAGEKSNCAKWFVGADAVFNLAAYVAGMLYNQSHHLEMYLQNARLQTAPVLAAADIGVPRFLQCSSVCVYAEEKQDLCIESDIGGAPSQVNAGYAWAKRMGERVAQWANLKHSIIVRPANIFGIHDYFDERAHVIPALIKKLLRDDVVRVNGTGQEVREFLYVDDAARGMMIALERGQTGEVYNIGTGGANACSIYELVGFIEYILETDKRTEYIGGVSGDARRIVSGDKLMQLGWRAETSLPDGLRRVCEWYQQCDR